MNGDGERHQQGLAEVGSVGNRNMLSPLGIEALSLNQLSFLLHPFFGSLGIVSMSPGETFAEHLRQASV